MPKLQKSKSIVRLSGVCWQDLISRCVPSRDLVSKSIFQMTGKESAFSNSAVLILCKEVRSTSCDLSVVHLENVGLSDDDAALLAGAVSFSSRR